MQNKQLIWLHDDALRQNHPVFHSAPPGTPAIYIWDDDQLLTAGYTLKRLVFVYETLITLPVQIVRGSAVEVLHNFEVDHVYVPETIDPYVKSVADKIPNIEFTFVADEQFVQIDREKTWKRFYQYWNAAEKTAFAVNGGKM